MSDEAVKPVFKWVSCYASIANALRENKDNQEKLVSIFQEISGSKETFDQVDPFSFFAAFNRHQKWESKTKIIQMVCSGLSIEAEVPEDFAGIPVVNNLKAWFRGGEESDFQYCWSLFELALDYADSKDYVDDAVFCEAFDAVLNIKNVGLPKLTMALYWIRPESFLPFDTNTVNYLKKNFDESFTTHKVSGKEYLAQLEDIRLFTDEPFYRLSEAAYEETKAEHGWWPSLEEYDLGFSSQQWVQMLEDKSIFSDNALALLKRMRHFGGEATCTQLSDYYGESFIFYSKNASATGQKIADKTGCLLIDREEAENSRYWPILFQGKKAPKDTQGVYIWKIRPELNDALDQVDLEKIPLFAERTQGTSPYCWLLSLPLELASFDEVKYSESFELTSCDGFGVPYELQCCFCQAREGDYIVGVQGRPTKKMVCICRINRASESGISISKIADAKRKVPLKEAKANPKLKGNSFIKGKLEEALISLSQEEFSCLVGLMGLPDYSIETSEVKEEIMSTQTAISLNTILCGPPGTGKTYETMAYAVAICDHGNPDEIVQKMSNGGYDEVAARYKELKAEGRIDFVTFHQSYGYEEFIEGIRPVLSSDQDTDDLGQVQYDRIDGSFKSFCEKAGDTAEILASVSDVPVFDENTNPIVWKIGLKIDSIPDLYKKCHEESVIRLGWDQVPLGEYETNETITRSNRACIQAFEEDMQPGDLFVVPGSDAKLVSVGVVIGDCEWNQNYPAAKRTRKVKWLGDFSKKEFKRLNGDKQLTLKTVYKLDRVSVVDLLRAMGKVPSAPLVKTSSEAKPYVFIIDEINRGNISRIFGELITLLEETKRVGAEEEMQVRLPYSGASFGVPSNVYVLGTMNTADRSIALMDTALRRRFDFKEMMPVYDILEDVDVEGIDIAEMLKTMNKRIEYLYDREHTLGHAYLIPLRENPNVDLLSEIFKNKIIPLLQEYFYDDYAKIRAVLGSAADEFIECKERDENLFPNDENVRPASVIYRVLSTPVDSESFIKIYQNETGN